MQMDLEWNMPGGRQKVAPPIMSPREQALTGSDFQLRVGSGRVVNLKVGLSGTLGSGSDKFSEVN